MLRASAPKGGSHGYCGLVNNVEQDVQGVADQFCALDGASLLRRVSNLPVLIIENPCASAPTGYINFKVPWLEVRISFEYLSSHNPYFTDSV